jgi:WD40 repeat protein
MAEPQVRIFVSSPSDLEHERALIKDIIEALAQEYLPYFKVQAILWEQEALTAAQSFQAGLVRPSECEIVLVMLWTRLGTPLADDPYGGMTGTEWEFVDAVEASARTGSPEVLVYRKNAPCLVDVNNAEVTREALADRHRLEEFFRAHFFNADGSFSRAFRQFSNDRMFRDLVETQLRKLLNRRISAERRLTSPQGDWRGSPFRVNRPFEFADNPVFTGREAETRELVTRLEALSGPGKGLLLVSGPSGVGKSSLIRAGLLPRLARPFLFPGISFCRWCLVDPDPDDPLLALALALTAPAMFGPALQGFGLDTPRLARLLATEPEVAADQVAAALAQLSEELANPAAGAGGRAQLAVVVDPLDPLFSDPARPAAGSRSFATALRLLAAQDGIWVIASLRSDYLGQFQELPELAADLDEANWFRLRPPAAARIRQVIEIPARIANIEYEDLTHGLGRGLVDALEAEASLLEHWPPVLQQTLDALYRQASAPAEEGGAVRHPVLTLDNFRRLGGLPGSLIARANAFWEDLDPPLRAAMPTLYRALIALEGGGTAAPGIRAGDLRTLTDLPVVARLIERMIAARLVVADAREDLAGPSEYSPAPHRLADDLRRLWTQTQEEWRVRLGAKGGSRSDLDLSDKAPTLATDEPEAPTDQDPVQHWRDYRSIASFIHPVLIERWQPVREWLAEPEHRRNLILRYQLSRQARLWRRTDSNREYLLGETGYASALDFATAHADELEPLERQYLEQSRQHLVLQRRRNRLARILGLTLVSLLILASSTAFWAWNASNDASLNFHRSQLKTAAVAIDRGNTAEAVRLALEAGPYLPEEATDTLSRTFIKNRLITLVTATSPTLAKPLGAAFSDDGQYLVTPASGGGAELWTLRGQRYHFDQPLFGPELEIHAVQVIGAGDPPLLLGIGKTGVWRLPATPGQAPAWTCGGRAQAPIAVAASRRYLALLHGEQRSRSLCVLDLEQPGEPLWDRLVHERGVRSLAFSPDGNLLVTASFDGTAKVIETLTGDERAVLPASGPLGRPAYHAEFDPAGKRVAVAWADDRIRIYDLKGRELAELGAIVRDGQKIRIHRSAVRKTAFAPGGKALVAVDEDGQVVRWDLETRQAQIFGHHELGVEQVQITSASDPGIHEPLVLTASLDDSIRLWGLWTGQGLAVMSHEGDVTEARFSRDQSRILSYSRQDGSARLWSVKPTETFALQFPGTDQVSHLAMAEIAESVAGGTDAATLLATAAHDGRVEVWRYHRPGDARPPQRLWNFGADGQGHRDRVRRVVFSPTARLLASAGSDGTARVWDLANGHECILTMTPDDQPCNRNGGADCPVVYQALFAPQGGWLLTTSSDPLRPVRLWDPHACAPLGESLPWEQGASGVKAAALTRGDDGRVWVATGDDAGEIRVLQVNDAGQWTQVCAGPWHRNSVNDLSFAPGGRQLVTASEDGRAALVSLAEGRCGEPRYLEPQGGAMTSARFAPDGEALVTATIDGNAQLWGADGSPLAQLSGHLARIATATFAPDGRWILTASRDGTVRLWPRPTAPLAQPLTAYLTLSAGLGSVSFASFSPDGNSIGAAYRNDATLIWEIWSEAQTPDRHLAAAWGPDRAHLALIQAAQRFMDENLRPSRPPPP